MAKTEYPECEKMHAVQEQSQTIGAFLDWLQNEQGFTICEYDRKDNLIPVGKTIEVLLADYFGIDLDKVEAERQTMLANIRKGNKS